MTRWHEELRERITAGQRIAVLRVKDDWHRRPAYPHQVGGLQMYTASSTTKCVPLPSSLPGWPSGACRSPSHLRVSPVRATAMPDACHLSPVGLESRGGLASLGRCGMLDVVSPLMKGQDMPYITLNSAEPGIRGLLRYRPETGRPLSELAEVLLRGPGTLTPGERELIAAYVSALNECRYCSASHAACAAAQLPGGMAVVEQVRSDASSAPVRAQLKSLLAIAAAVQQGGLHVTAELVAQARAAGATDLEIHDTVLIAAVFCMFNRYVDGLATIAPEDPALYAAGAQRLITDGYLPAGEPPSP